MPASALSISEDEEEERDAMLPLFLAGERCSPSAGSVPVIQTTARVSGVPMVAGTPSSGGVPGSAASSSPVPPPSFTSQAPQMATQLTQVGTAPPAPVVRSERSPGESPHLDHPHHPRRSGTARHRPSHGTAHVGGLLSLPKWPLVILVCLVLATGSVGAWAWLSHGRFVGTDGSSHAQSPRTRTTQVSHAHATASATSSTGGAQGRSIAVLRYSGALAGQMSIVAFSPLCGLQKESGGHYYALSVEGTLGGRTYIFDLLVRPYGGPGAYTTARSDTTENDSHYIRDGTTDVWGSTQGQATITGDGKSGTFDIGYQGVADPANLLAAPSPAHVSGSWTCGQAWGTTR